ncbi:MAG TPA: ADP-ribosylglycohydrolase family protein [Gemmatimonadales bacterium]|nr:ADP-ribosylglycohydrolase family protein [Gemmatimonadales bacterium]
MLPLDAADRLTGCLLGQALGDALGFVVEAQPPDVAEAYVRDWLLAGRAGARAHPDFPFGQYSDDTQLARELLISVRDIGGWHPAAFAARIAELFRAGADVGAGDGTRGAAQRLLAGASWLESGTPAPYAGNGSAMRAAPLGLLFAGDPAALRTAVRDQSRITHLDPRCAAGAVAVAGAALLATAPGPLDPREVLRQLTPWVGAEDASVARAVAGVEAWLALEPSAAAARLRAEGLDPGQVSPWLGISAFVTPSVAWSLYAFLRTPDDYRTTVCTAIAVGGDTDTMGAIAGALAGARLGPDALPPDLLARLTDRGRWGASDLARLAADCARYAR